MVMMYKTEGGIVALYRGILPTVTGVAPYVSLQMWGKELWLTDHRSGSTL